jgi:adenine-specific DNA-methyltransferase
VITSSGKLLEIVEIDYKRNVMGGMRWTHEWVREAEDKNRELLFLIERSGSVSVRENLRLI